MDDVVAFVTGTAARRRAVLEWAARYAGHTGRVHVVCDGLLPPAVTSSIMLMGLMINAERIEHADFAEAAQILAPFGCAWTWRHTPLGARGLAMRIARQYGAVVVVPRRYRVRAPSVQILTPVDGVAERTIWGRAQGH